MYLKLNMKTQSSIHAINYYVFLFDGAIIKKEDEHEVEYIKLFNKVPLALDENKTIDSNAPFTVIFFTPFEKRTFDKAVERINNSNEITVNEVVKDYYFNIVLFDFTDKYKRR